MAYVLNLKNGSNKVLGGLIFLCSIVILIFQSSFIEDFSLHNFEDILSILSISSILTLILYYIGIKEFLVLLFARVGDFLWKMPKEINFRSIQKSIHLRETNNSLISTLMTFCACSLLFLINLNTTSGIYRILFEGFQNNNNQTDPLLGSFPHIGLLIILFVLLVFLGIRLCYEVKKNWFNVLSYEISSCD